MAINVDPRSLIVEMLRVIAAPVSNQENTTFDFVSLATVLCGFMSMDLIIVLKIKEILQHPQRDGQMVKSLTASLVNREEEERHQKNLNENEQLKKQIAERPFVGEYYPSSVVGVTRAESGKQVDKFCGAPQSNKLRCTLGTAGPCPTSSGARQEQADPGQLSQLQAQDVILKGKLLLAASKLSPSPGSTVHPPPPPTTPPVTATKLPATKGLPLALRWNTDNTPTGGIRRETKKGTRSVLFFFCHRASFFLIRRLGAIYVDVREKKRESRYGELELQTTNRAAIWT
ncbi:hypothetical protein RRG08_053366 [Elysia crispata]|uniref:Uncharacterized protein n=1 Tax=Elysia crispata TaxID=231223 RepID=A0AAE0Z5U5_9GAST|nr:hypothetical protein RRG08_053366 [Elysia crispata]